MDDMADTFRVTFEGKKYDLKRFLRDHPGGTNTLKYYKDKSIVNAMAKFGHSNSAYHMLNDFAVDGDELKDSNLTGKVSENGRIITNDEAERDVKEIEFLEELESRLDWSKPILSQLHLIAPHYDKWVNSAVYRKCRLFASPILESMTYTPWFLVPMFWIPVILYTGITQFLEHVACGESCTEDNLTMLQYFYHIVLGVSIWTGLEYSLHRWVFHLDPGTKPAMIRLHFLLHGIHHKVPFDGLRLVFPPVPAVMLAFIAYVPIRILLSYPVLKFVGGMTGYLVYDMIHYYVHHGSPKDGTYLYMVKRYHSNHHFINHDKAFGISSDIWDRVFNTFAKVRNLGFSLQW